MAFPLLLIAAAGALVVVSGKKKKRSTPKEEVPEPGIRPGSLSSFRAPAEREQFETQTSPADSGPTPPPPEEPSGAPSFGPENCDFGLAINRDGTACVPGRLAPGWVPLHETFSKRPDGQWAGPTDVVYSLSTPSFKKGNQYSAGERRFLATVADGYGLTDILSEKPKNWSSRTNRIIKLVGNHPANHAVLGRTSDDIKFKWRVGKGKDGYTIKELHPKKSWHAAPESIEDRLAPGDSYGIILLPAE